MTKAGPFVPPLCHAVRITASQAMMKIDPARMSPSRTMRP